MDDATKGDAAGDVAGRTVELVAHRGASADAPENTLAAFRLAWERGVTTIELDVHLTRDDQLVVIHDADTQRTTGTSRPIKDSALAELRGLDAGSWKDPRYAGERLPTLAEALATIPENGRCLIEVKVGPEAVPALVKAVRASGKAPAQLTIISFHADTVAEAKRQLPELKAFFLSSFRKDKTTGAFIPTIDELIAKARAIKADGLDLNAHGPLDAASVAKIKQAGLEVHAWTVDDPDTALRLARAGVDSITTNKPAWLREQLEGR